MGSKDKKKRNRKNYFNNTNATTNKGLVENEPISL